MKARIQRTAPEIIPDAQRAHVSRALRHLDANVAGLRELGRDARQLPDEARRLLMRAVAGQPVDPDALRVAQAALGSLVQANGWDYLAALPGAWAANGADT